MLYLQQRGLLGVPGTGTESDDTVGNFFAVSPSTSLSLSVMGWLFGESSCPQECRQGRLLDFQEREEVLGCGSTITTPFPDGRIVNENLKNPCDHLGCR